jgi:CRISPR-associated endonuclease/helicase Cas3
MLTGQFATGVRREREKWLRRAFGPGGTPPYAVVIGTQVLERGLDLDFDVVVSDVTPIDLAVYGPREEVACPRGSETVSYAAE